MAPTKAGWVEPTRTPIPQSISRTLQPKTLQQSCWRAGRLRLLVQLTCSYVHVVKTGAIRRQVL